MSLDNIPDIPSSIKKLMSMPDTVIIIDNIECTLVSSDFDQTSTNNEGIVVLDMIVHVPKPVPKNILNQKYLYLRRYELNKEIELHEYKYEILDRIVFGLQTLKIKAKLISY